jgi:hypothetical protein
VRSLRLSRLAALLLAAALLGGCGQAPAQSSAQARPRLGLMTSLPLYWPQAASLGEIASGRAAPPWQRRMIETRFELVPLDTLSPIPAPSPDQPESDPLAGLERLAVIQPRGLSPADNVALDDWVRRGGRLLLVLDPMLTGTYAAPLGDPRRPVDSVMVPPVVRRWGLSISYPAHADGDAVPAAATMPGGVRLPLADAGVIARLPGAGENCTVHAATLATCRIGKGQVMLLADAGLFEHPELAGADGAALLALLAAAFG